MFRERETYNCLFTALYTVDRVCSFFFPAHRILKEPNSMAFWGKDMFTGTGLWFSVLAMKQLSMLTLWLGVVRTDVQTDNKSGSAEHE